MRSHSWRITADYISYPQNYTQYWSFEKTIQATKSFHWFSQSFSSVAFYSSFWLLRATGNIFQGITVGLQRPYLPFAEVFHFTLDVMIISLIFYRSRQAFEWHAGTSRRNDSKSVHTGYKDQMSLQNYWEHQIKGEKKTIACTYKNYNEAKRVLYKITCAHWKNYPNIHKII